MSAVVFDTGQLKRTYFRLALPSVLSMLVTLVYNFTDTYFIARTGDADLVAGVSLCLPLMMALMAFGNIFGQGGSSLISRLLGRGDRESSRRISSFCFYSALLTGAVLGVFFLSFREPCLRLLGADADTLPHARPYYTVFALASPVVVVHFIHMNLLRCEGYAAESMKGNILGSVVNIVLDPLLIFTFGLGSLGAAAASVIGYAAGTLYLFVFVLRKSVCLSVSFKKCRAGRDEIRQILGVGFTAAIANLTQSFAQVLMNQSLLRYGNVEIAAMGIASKINLVALLVMTGFSFGGVPLFGYVYGSGDRKKLRELIGFCLCFLSSLALLFTLVLCLADPWLVRIFMENEQVLRSGTRMLRFLASGTLFAAVSLLFTVIFQATGRVLPALVMSLGRQGVMFFLVLLLLRSLFGYYGVLASQPAADFISAILAVFLYRKGKDGA